MKQWQNLGARTLLRTSETSSSGRIGRDDTGTDPESLVGAFRSDPAIADRCLRQLDPVRGDYIDAGHRPVGHAYAAGGAEPADGSLLAAISWPGYPPQSIIIAMLIVLLLYGVGLRWESVAALAAGVFEEALDLVVKGDLLKTRLTH